MDTITVTLDEATLQRALENMKDPAKNLDFTRYCIFAEAARPFMGDKRFACGPMSVEVSNEKFETVEDWRPVRSEDEAHLNKIVMTFDEVAARITPKKSVEEIRALLPFTVELHNVKA